MSVHSMPVLSAAEVAGRVDALIAGMTVAEKAGQLTQYFYFAPAAGAEDRRRRSGPDRFAGQPRHRRGGAGAGRGRVAAVRHRPGGDQPAAAAAVEGNRHGIPVLFGFDVIHGLRTILPVPIAMAASWDPGDDRAGPGRRRPRGAGGRHPLGVRADGRHRPRPALGPDHRGRRRGPVPRRGGRRRAGARLPGRRPRRPERVIAGPKHFAGYGAALGGRDYDEVDLSDAELWNVVLPAVQGRGRRRRRQHHDRLHGPQRHPGHRQPLAARRGAARDVGLRRLRGQRRQRRAQPRHPRVRGRPDRRRRAGADGRRRHGDGDRRPRLRAPARGGRGRRGRRGGARRLRPAGARRRSSGWACSTTPYVDEDRAREVLADPAHREAAREAARALGGPAPQRGRPAAARRRHLARSPSSGRWPTPGATRSGPGSSTSTSTRRSRCSTASGTGPATGSRSSYAPGIRPAQRVFPSMFDMFGGNAPEDPDGLRRRRRARRARSTLARGVRRRRGRARRVAEHDRRGGLPLLSLELPGGAARAAAGGGGHRHARSCCW